MAGAERFSGESAGDPGEALGNVLDVRVVEHCGGVGRRVGV
ncbi:MAG: hypothetical protein QM783_02590 [Phycisphaerales bacterium]